MDIKTIKGICELLTVLPGMLVILNEYFDFVNIFRIWPPVKPLFYLTTVALVSLGFFIECNKSPYGEGGGAEASGMTKRALVWGGGFLSFLIAYYVCGFYLDSNPLEAEWMMRSAVYLLPLLISLALFCLTRGLVVVVRRAW